MRWKSDRRRRRRRRRWWRNSNIGDRPFAEVSERSRPTDNCCHQKSSRCQWAHLNQARHQLTTPLTAGLHTRVLFSQLLLNSVAFYQSPANKYYISDGSTMFLKCSYFTYCQLAVGFSVCPSVLCFHVMTLITGRAHSYIQGGERLCKERSARYYSRAGKASSSRS